jgi:hypothetical protein
MKDQRLKSFAEDAVRSLGFLAADFDFDGPKTPQDYFVGYISDRWRIWAVLDERNKTVDTYVHYDFGDNRPGLSVWELVRAAELKGVGQQKTSAITRAGVQKSLSAQARALRRLLPLLLSDDGPSLMSPHP